VLVLSRHRSERVIIGEWEIVVTVVDIRGDKVRIGFEAPSSISVHREETLLRIEEDRREAARNGGAA
jgi:carbon storage regulator